MAGNVNLTQTQMQMAIAVLLNVAKLPSGTSYAANGAFLGPDGTLQFPDNTVNEALGQNINAFTDGTNIHIGFVNSGAAAILG